jgi:hypothetical protein
MAVCLWGMLSGADRRTLRFNLPVKSKSLEGGANLVSARMNISLPLWSGASGSWLLARRVGNQMALPQPVHAPAATNNHKRWMIMLIVRS